MGVTLKWNKSVDQIIKQNILGKDTMTFIASEAKRIMSPFTPYDTGTLDDTTQIEATDTTAQIRYVQSYSAAVFYNNRGVTFQKTHHPLASAHWDKVAMESGGKERLIASTNEYIKKKG